MKHNPFVSVIIPTYNREDFVINLIKDLSNQDYNNFEVIVIDQSEKDCLKLKNLIDDSLKKMKVVYLKDKKRGVSRARNLGIFNSKGDFIVFLDDDISIPNRNFLDEHIKCYHNLKVGGVAGRVIEKTPKPKWGPVGKVFPIVCIPGGNIDGSKIMFVDTGKGMNMSFRRFLLDKIGGFDERFGAPSLYEETDVFLKIKKLGYKIVFNPNAAIIHFSAIRGGQRQVDENHFRFVAFRDRVLLFHNNYSKWLFPFFILGNIILALKPILKLKLKAVWFALKGLLTGIRNNYFSKSL